MVGDDRRNDFAYDIAESDESELLWSTQLIFFGDESYECSVERRKKPMHCSGFIYNLLDLHFD